MAFKENIEQFFSDEDFAVVAELTLTSGANRLVKAIFESPTQSLELYETTVDASGPRLFLPTSKSDGIKRGATARIDKKTYSIERVTCDGTGITVLYLK